MDLQSLRRPGVRAIAIAALGSVLLFQVPWSTAASSKGNDQPATVAVNCEPSQQAVVRQTMVNGEVHVNIQCVGTGYAQQPVLYTDQYGRPLQTMPAGAVGPTPVAYQPAVYQAPQAYPAPQTYPAQQVYAPAPAPRRVSTQRVVTERAERNGRSWKKTALVIGGSAGTGAGVGGLVGGKKGAAIGAALGGGAASIYEATKR